MSDGSLVKIGGNDNTTMSVYMTIDNAQILATKEIEVTNLNVSVPGLAGINGKARILVSHFNFSSIFCEIDQTYFID